jgi:hypothetical protein
MLLICADTVPQTNISYLAFRLAAFETFKLIEFAQQTGQEFRDPFGYLTEVPFLREVAPQVQLSLLAETWAKLTSAHPEHATLLDESVVYAVCETAARIMEQIPELFSSFTETGPVKFLNQPDKKLVRDLRTFHLELSNEGDFLLISQFQDLDPSEAANYKQQFRMSDDYLEPMFEVLGRWQISANIQQNFAGLFNEDELTELMPILKLATSAVRQFGN